MAKRQRNKIDGWINLNKPSGIGSTQALGIVKRALSPQKAGHAGTLDPLASGILPIALGEATKTVPYMQDRAKSYRFTVKWGEATDTDDCEGNIIETSEHRPDRQAIDSILPTFIGEIEQVPPRYSAVKIDGQRAYDLARAGEDFTIKTRHVTIDSLVCLNANENSAEFECHCGKGTYVRSIARDMALALGTYGHITALERLNVGPMTLDNAISLDFFKQDVHIEDEIEFLSPIETVLDDIPALPLEDGELVSLRLGRVLTFLSPYDLQRLDDAGLSGSKGQIAAIYNRRGACEGLVKVTGVEIKTERLLNL